MLVRQWISERVGGGYVNFERLCVDLMQRADSEGIDVTTREIRVILEKLIRDGTVETCQYLAEDQRYQATIYDDSNIYWYWFRMRQGAAHD